MPATLVTGGTGLIGYNIIMELLARKRRVRTLVRSVEKALAILPPECDIIQGDITDKESMKKAIFNCDIVYHAAGLPEQWRKDPLDFSRVNTEGTRNITELANLYDVKKFVYTSSLEVFGATKGQTYTEKNTDNNSQQTPYAISKHEADEIVVKAIENGLPAVFVHPAAVYGPGPTFSQGVNDLISRLIEHKIHFLTPGELPLVYAPDVALGHLLAEENGTVGERYILSESFVSLYKLTWLIHKRAGITRRIPRELSLTLARWISRLSERISHFTGKPPIISSDQLTFLQWGAIPSAQNARTELNWKPTALEKGIYGTIKYLNPDLTESLSVKKEA